MAAQPMPNQQQQPPPQQQQPYQQQPPPQYQQQQQQPQPQPQYQQQPQQPQQYPQPQQHYSPQPQQSYPQQPQQPQHFDAAMMPTQNAQLNLEGWDPQINAGRGALAWIAIVLCGWMALVRVGQGGLGLAVSAAGASGAALGSSVISFLAAAFYVWATIGLYKQNPKAYRAVMRVNAILAVLGLIGTFLSFGTVGMGIATIINLVGVAFHVVALLITYLARDNLGNEWSS